MPCGGAFILDPVSEERAGKALKGTNIKWKPRTDERSFLASDSESLASSKLVISPRVADTVPTCLRSYRGSKEAQTMVAGWSVFELSRRWRRVRTPCSGATSGNKVAATGITWPPLAQSVQPTIDSASILLGPSFWGTSQCATERSRGDTIHTYADNACAFVLMGNRSTGATFELSSSRTCYKPIVSGNEGAKFGVESSSLPNVQKTSKLYSQHYLPDVAKKIDGIRIDVEIGSRRLFKLLGNHFVAECRFMRRLNPWSKHNSSLPSDRLKPKGAPNVAKPKAKGKQTPQPPEPPKSRDVRRIETLSEGVRNGTGRERDPKGGCFCLARLHTLSPYTPLCQSCGLILCSVNLPQYSCPHCGSIMMTPASRESLIAQLDAELASTIAKEIAERERAVEEAQRAVGAFPSLMPSSSPSLAQPHPQAPPPAKQTHKVMSLTGSNNRRVLVSSYTTTPVQSRPVSRGEDAEEEPNRVPPPPAKPPCAPRAPSSKRPWENLIDGPVSYQPPARLDDDSAKPSRRRRKPKGKENDGADRPAQGDS
ncbi:hypothetical protein BDN70DRAFT_920562 [Pholiota conissans]|uniref:TRIP4/RQT4 C2HC5-type zinc finger domain-containing protein n=1 Tax=Pholiota conissans TaxID=109636 RepID=A0A9P6D274_9AGAR|nr:hypothetical protein BDN70DRAFT_920562 [Pholiota conissans]